NNTIKNNHSKNSSSGKAGSAANSRKTTSSRKSSAPKSRKKSHGGGILKRLLRKILVLAVILFGIYSAVALLLISKLEKIPRMPRTVTTGTLDAGHVQNILLIGTDARDITTERGRSDTILLLSMNSMTEKIYLTSFMRDAYVQIPGYGNNKLNAAYAYGGAELLMDTLEQNYQISIDDYFCVSFMGFAGIIDAFGGVEIDVSDAEAQAVNEILQSEVNALAGDDIMSDFLEKGGKFILNGKQALSYARIRYVGNADFERTSRQREVMTQIFQNMKSKAATAVPELISSALPHVGANMSTTELYFLSLKAPLVVSYEIEQLQIPANGTYTPADIDGQSVLQVDFNANTQILKDTVYSLPEPTEYTGSANP
ncbi:MAG: LCP family protein, partial [Oscillospiraceae bacterium]|nr:LCP family protein [Oscillospiraceae bacterium]